ncbi:MAG: alpha/beta hydrolase-fold protein [Fimbriimonadaceae bacterium]|jgi:polyhydroxybutyrate depolymerase|nr:alpha/beta hydrolase-fold protein [Fimbriimonadaceae bacterium]
MTNPRISFLLIGGLVFAGTLSLVAAQQRISPNRLSNTLTVDGRERTYLLRAPGKVAKGQKLPLVIVLHGGGGSGQNAEDMSQMTPFAREKKFFVAYPDGTGNRPNRLLTWNAGNCCDYALEHNVDDIKFIRSLITELVAKNPIDAKRVYVTGMSNGGMMSHRIAMELGDLVAAVGPVAGAMNIPPQAGPPVGVIMIHGEADQHVIIQGGTPTVGVAKDRTDASLQDAVDHWIKRNQLDPKNSTRLVKGDATITTYPGTFSVQTVVIKNEGHTWPGGQKGSARGDQPSSTVQANEYLWEFFQKHSR